MEQMDTENKNSLPGLREKRNEQKRKIIRDLYRLGTLSKPEICRLTNMTVPTITRIIEELIEEGWVVNQGQGPSIGGKRPYIFALNPDAAYIIGIDLGRELLKIAVFNLHKETIGSIQVFPSLLETEKNEVILRDLKIKIEKTLIDAKIPRAKIRVAGVSIPGLLDSSGNAFSYLSFNEGNVRQRLEKMLGIPVFIDNDSSVMAMAEHSFGAAKDAKDALCVSVNECIGLGMILNGHPYTGCKGMAGEFGHIRVSGKETLCYCGKTGCLETVASGRALVKAAADAIKKGQPTYIQAPEGVVTLDAIVEAATKDDIFAIDLLQRAGEKIGEGLATLIHLFNPELIVIGGKMTANNSILLPSIRRSIDRYTLTRLKNQCEIQTSTLGENACILGTLSLVMEHLHYGPSENVSLY